MNKEQAMAFITSTDWKGSSLGLSRMEEMMALLHNPQQRLHVVHVAGTNGKGSCCAMLSSILKKAGYRTGMYTSPHLLRFEERFLVDGREISEEDFCRTAEIVSEAAAFMEDKPTEFEILTAMAFVYFDMMKCDAVMLEVGLGGRLDATNIIKDPDACVIMNIGLDHTDILGDTPQKIAYEKAGIIKEGCDVVIYEYEPDVTAVFEKTCDEKHARLHKTDFSQIEILSEGIGRQAFSYKGLENLRLSLLGRHQFNNAAVVIETANVLKEKGYDITEEHIRSGLADTQWAARLSVIGTSPLFILDGAHNPQCSLALKESLPALLQESKAVFLCGMLKDKDYESVMDMMAPFAKEFICLTPVSKRALAGEKLAEILNAKSYPARACASFEDGVRTAEEAAGSDGVVIGFGSLYLAGYLMEAYNRIHPETI